MDIIFDYIPTDRQVQFKIKIKAVKTGDWQIAALPFEERPYAVDCQGMDNPVKVKKESQWERYTVGGCLNIRVQNDTAIVSEMPLPLESKVDTYIVIFREWTSNNREQVLSVEGVNYVNDTTFGDQGYPALIISTNQSTADKIKEYNFIYDVQPVVIVPDVMPRAETKMTTGLPVFSVIFLILFIWWIKRKGLK